MAKDCIFDQLVNSEVPVPTALTNHGQLWHARVDPSGDGTFFHAKFQSHQFILSHIKGKKTKSDHTFNIEILS